MKKILLLGGSAQQLVAIRAAKELGYYTVLMDYGTDCHITSGLLGSKILIKAPA